MMSRAPLKERSAEYSSEPDPADTAFVLGTVRDGRSPAFYGILALALFVFIVLVGVILMLWLGLADFKIPGVPYRPRDPD